MILPSIDISGGHAVRLAGGQDKVFDAGDPRPLIERLRLAGEIALVDVDAATGRGSNAELLRSLLSTVPCRVGGGIRTVDDAIAWLDAGAAKVILGTAAVPDVLRELPRERVIAALDAEHGEVVVDGWRTRTGARVADRMQELRGLAGGFLVTFVEREGRMRGIDLTQVEELVRAAGDTRLTVAGGITTTDEIAAIDRLGADAQLGMALHSGRLDLADAIGAPLTSDRLDRLFPTLVCDEHGVALGLAYSSRESLRQAVGLRRGIYHSLAGGPWMPGAETGAPQELLRVALDCDRSTLRFTVRPSEPSFCHEGTRTCWGEDAGLTKLARTLAERRASAPAGSYSKRLFDDPELLRSKLLEEANELCDATTPADIAWEAADVIYFAMVAAARAGVPLSAIEAELDRRALKVTRRRGDAKKPPEKP